MMFEEWWEKHGQFCRAGGGEYEKTFAFHAWEAAEKVEREECARIAERFEPDERLDYVTYASSQIRERANAKFSGQL